MSNSRKDLDPGADKGKALRKPETVRVELKPGERDFKLGGLGKSDLKSSPVMRGGKAVRRDPFDIPVTEEPRKFGRPPNDLRKFIAKRNYPDSIPVVGTRIKNRIHKAADKDQISKAFSGASFATKNSVSDSSSIGVELTRVAAIIQYLLDRVDSYSDGMKINYSKPLILTLVGDRTIANVVEQGRRSLTRIDVPDEIPSVEASSVIGDNLVFIVGRTFKIDVENGSIFASSVESFSGPETLNKYQRAVLARPRPDRPASAEENRAGQMVRVRLNPALVDALDQAARDLGATRTSIVENALASYLRPKMDPRGGLTTSEKTKSVVEHDAVPREAPMGEQFRSHARPGEDIVSFLDRVYGQRGLLNGEFTRADLRRIDPSAAIALNNWEKGNKIRPKGRAPLNLPTVAERNDKLLLEKPMLIRPEEAREYDRKRSVRRRRQMKATPAGEPPNGERYSTHAKPGEDAVQFIERVYGRAGMLTGEFTRADLRRIDPSAAVALNNWEKGNRARPKGRAPLNLPTLAERNDRLLADGGVMTDDPKETARRAAAAMYRAAKTEHTLK